MITTRRIRVRVAAAAMLVLFSRPASAQLLQKLTTQVTSTINTIACTPAVASSKIDDGIRTWLQGGGTGGVPIIVTSGSGVLPTVQSLVARVSGPLQSFDGIDALVTRATSSQLSALACDAGVASISLDAAVKSFAAAADGEDGTSYSLRGTLGLGAAGPSGRGVGVAVVDSGVAAHPDVASRLAASLDFTKGDIASVPPSDLYGHGTHVAGLIAGAGAQAGMAAFRGVAPEATLFSLKVLDANGNGRTSDVIRAVLYATAWSGGTTWGQHIVWGTSDPVWGSHIVWGTGYTGTTDGQHIVWGTTGGPDGTVWGNVAPIADDTGTPPDGI